MATVDDLVVSVNLLIEETHALLLAYGGTGETEAIFPTTTKGDIIVHNGTVNIRFPVGGDGQALVADSAESAGVKWATAKLDLSAFLQGTFDDAEKLMTFVATTAFTLPLDLSGSSAYADVPATAAATFDVRKNGGASLGTINFALGANVGTFTFAAPTAFAVGDRLEIVNQATADLTLADVSLTLRGEL